MTTTVRHSNRHVPPRVVAALCLLAACEIGDGDDSPDAERVVTVPAPLAGLDLGYYDRDQLETMAPPGPNPYLSWTPPGARVDWAYWSGMNDLTQIHNAERSHARPRVDPLPNLAVARGVERVFVPPFGPGTSARRGYQIPMRAELSPPASMKTPEDEDGSISNAASIDVRTGEATRVAGFVGDGAFGSTGTGSGDFDFFALPDLRAGQLVMVDVDTPDGSSLDSFVVLWDAEGRVLDFNPAQSPDNRDSFMLAEVPVDGDYFVSVGAVGSFAPNDPFDPSSGLGDGLTPLNEGEYEVLIGVDYFDQVVFDLGVFNPSGFVLEVGTDTLISNIEVFEDDALRQASFRNPAFVYPPDSPLRESENVSNVAIVIDSPRHFRVAVQTIASGDYTLTLRATDPRLENASRGSVQRIFLDFDGASVPVDGVDRQLSPLADFLPRWGLGAGDEDAVIDAVVASVRENLVDDLIEARRNPKFAIELLNSRDHADPFGEPNVSRVVIGGTIPEFGVETIGLAQSLDVGNMATEETGVVLLDLLSEPADPAIPGQVTLNRYDVAGNASKADLVGLGVGTIAAHEVGHYLGNWHTQNFREEQDIMASGGGDLAIVFGLGPDLTLGTADDVDVDFGSDEFMPGEFYRGVEDTAGVIAVGATTPGWPRWPWRQ